MDYSARVADYARKLGLKVIFHGSAPRGEPAFNVDELAKLKLGS